MVSLIQDTLDFASRIQPWALLGWPSLEVWEAADRPEQAYADWLTRNSTTPRAETGAAVPASEDDPAGMAVTPPAPLPNPFTQGVREELVREAQQTIRNPFSFGYTQPLMPGGNEEMLRAEQSDLMSAQEQMLVAQDPSSADQFGYEIDRVAPAGSLRETAMQTGAQGYGSIAQGLKNPETIALLGLGVAGPGLANLAGFGGRAALGLAAPRVTQEMLGLEQLPGAAAGDVARDVLPGVLGEATGQGIEFALDPATLAGLGMRGPKLLANWLGQGTLSTGQHLGSAFGAGFGSAVGEEVAGTPGAIVGGFAGGLGGLVAPRVGGAVVDAAGRSLYGALEDPTTFRAVTGALGAAGGGTDPRIDAWIKANKDTLVSRGMSEADIDLAARQRQMMINKGFAPEQVDEFMGSTLVRTAREVADDSAAASAVFRESEGLTKRAAVLSGQDPSTLRPTMRGRVMDVLREEGGYLEVPPVEWPTMRQNLMSLLSAPKQLQTFGDVAGSSFRQNLPVAFIDPKVWATNFRRSAKAYLSDPAAAEVWNEIQSLPRFLDGDEFFSMDGTKHITIPSMREVLGLGEDFATPGFENFGDTAVQRFIQSIPGYRQSERSMRVALVGAATDLRNQMIDAAVRAGIDNPRWYLHYGDIAKVATGYGNVPEGLKGISRTFYSLRNIAARFQTLTQPFTMPGPALRSVGDMVADKAIFSASPRGVATKNLFRFLAGETANLMFLSHAGQQSGMFEAGWNPLESDYGKLSFVDDDGNTHNLDLLGGYGSLIRAIARTAAAASDAVQGNPQRYDPVAEWLKFTRYKLAPLPAITLDSIIAASPGLKDADALQSPFAFDPSKIDLSDPKTWLTAGLPERILPFFLGEQVQNMINGELKVSDPNDLLKAGAHILTQFVGLPTSMYTGSGYDRQDAVAKREFGAEFADLSPGQQAEATLKAIDEGFEVDESARMRPYWNADDYAYGRLLQEKPEVAQMFGPAEDIDTFRQNVEAIVIEVAKIEGVELDPDQLSLKVKQVYDKIGLSDMTRGYRAAAVATDPEIAAIYERRHFDEEDEFDYDFNLNKQLREIAKAASQDPAVREQILAELQAAGYR